MSTCVVCMLIQRRMCALTAHFEHCSSQLGIIILNNVLLATSCPKECCHLHLCQSVTFCAILALSALLICPFCTSSSLSAQLATFRQTNLSLSNFLSMDDFSAATHGPSGHVKAIIAHKTAHKGGHSQVHSTPFAFCAMLVVLRCWGVLEGHGCC